MQTLRVNIPGREYDIKIGKGLIEKTGELIEEIVSPCRVMVVTDSNVDPLYCGKVIKSLENAGFITDKVTVPAGETSKSMEMLNFLYGKILDFKVTRSDLIVALGGGVVGDLTGFCASTLLRGIPFVQIPTTLLAQVDSSVGGKVAVNLPQGKNLVGSFYQPRLVIIDPECLNTLSDRIFGDGMAEVIKYGLILDNELFERLEGIETRAEMMEHIEDVIYCCCNLKRIVVEDDELDTGRRMILNFGHTFGHAIEKKYNFTDYTHGEAVAAGMVMAAELGEGQELTPKGTSERIRCLIRKYGLPEEVQLDRQSLIDAVAVDKKGDGDMVNLILLSDVGNAVIKKIKKKDI